MRFAHEHAPLPPRRGFWIASAGIFLGLIAGVAAINLLVDPADVRVLPHLALARRSVTVNEDRMLWAVGESRKISRAVLDRVTLVAVGDSRVETFTNWQPGHRVVKIGSDYFLNLGIGGSSFDENIEFLTAELPRLPRLRGVIIAAPIERTGVVAAASRVRNGVRTYDAPWRHLISLQTLMWSGKILRARFFEEDASPDEDFVVNDLGQVPDISSIVFDPYKKRAASAEETTVVRSRGAGIELYRWAFATVDFDLIQRRIDTGIAPLAKELSRRNIKVVFFFPPLRPKVRQLAGPQINAAQLRYTQMLAGLGVIEDFSVGTVDGITPRFRDLSHVFPSTAQAILGDIYRRNFGTAPASDE